MPRKPVARPTKAAPAKPAPGARAKPGTKPGTKSEPRALDSDAWLDAALAEAAATGWTRDLPAGAARRLKAEPALATVVFPMGVRDIVAALNARADLAMQRRIAADPGFRHGRVRQKIAFAIRARLEALAEHRPALQRLTGWATRPDHALQSLRAIWATADTAWFEAGDTSTDYNHYTKRLLLSAVIVATKLFWLRDESARQTATWTYLDARIDDVLSLGQKLGGLKQLAVLGRKFMDARQRPR